MKIVVLMEEHSDFNEIKELVSKEIPQEKAYELLPYYADSWNDAYSPWPTDPVFGTEGFGGKGRDTLTDILDYVNQEPICLAGYSLAGLFALWASYESGLIDGVAACSPSLWYPDWDRYAATNACHASSVYLSLGDREKNTKNKLMLTVEDRVRAQAALLNCKLEMNQGGHFKDVDLRLAKGIIYLINAK